MVLTMSATFRALGDPTRCAIVEHLAHGAATVGDLAAPHAMSLPAITKHLRVLERAGLVRRERIGRQVRCTLEPRALEDVASWADQQRRFWTGALDRLEDVLTTSGALAQLAEPLPASDEQIAAPHTQENP